MHNKYVVYLTKMKIDVKYKRIIRNVCTYGGHMNQIDIDKNSSVVKTIVKAIVKAVGSDFDEYKKEQNLKTNNNCRFARGDLINTNISSMLPDLEAISFNRSGWQGILWKDRKSKLTYSIISEQALKRALATKEKETPHYVLCIINAQNQGVAAESEQPSLFDDSNAFPGIGDENLFGQNKFVELYSAFIGYSVGAGYTHLVIAYAEQGGIIMSIRLILFAEDFEICREWNLMDMVRPDFLTLTKDDVDERNSTDIHRLVSVKASVKENHVPAGDENPLVSLKEEEGKKQG